MGFIILVVLIGSIIMSAVSLATLFDSLQYFKEHIIIPIAMWALLVPLNYGMWYYAIKIFETSK